MMLGAASLACHLHFIYYTVCMIIVALHTVMMIAITEKADCGGGDAIITIYMTL